MSKTISDKMGIKEYSRCYFLNTPENFFEIIESQPLNISEILEGKFDYIHIFMLTQFELKKAIEKLKPYLSEKGHFWISWPKAKKLETDLSLPIIIKIVYQNGLVESKVISIDNSWSAIKITKPIEGRVYKNSYGILDLD